ncbi:heavy-metal-associated domain-containing protein [Halobaculum sp. D14]|uniref:heavy-metal-associated domain-containing protein n=1 Tax=unclassified Halobaculum TaxID=2640896 RepID=UPI003EBE293F
METHELTVTGMQCASCEALVTQAVTGLDGVAAVESDAARDRVVVRADDERADDSLRDRVEQAITETGYTVDG